MSHRLMVAVAVLVAQAAFAQNTPQTHGKPARQYAKGTWQVVREIGIADEMFDNPALLAVDDGRAVVFDEGSGSIKSVGLDGRLQWKSGRQGQGPGEYVHATSLRLDDAGRAIIYDDGAQRITTLDRQGKLLGSVPATGRFDLGLAGASSSEFLLLNRGSDTLVTRVDTMSRLTAMTPLPADLHRAAAFGREINGAASTPTGHMLAFRWSSLMMQVDRQGRLVRSCTAVDSLSFPPVTTRHMTVANSSIVATRVDTQARQAAIAIAALGGSTLVLRPRARADSQMTLDVYARDCGRYVESRLLPVRTYTIAANADVIVAVVEEPVPHLTVLRWKANSQK